MCRASCKPQQDGRVSQLVQITSTVGREQRQNDGFCARAGDVRLTGATSELAHMLGLRKVGRRHCAVVWEERGGGGGAHSQPSSAVAAATVRKLKID